MRVVQPSPGLHNITILVAQQKFVRSSIWLHMKYSIQFSGAQTKFMWSFATGSLLSYIPSQWNGYCYRFCLYIYLVYFNYLGCYCGVKQIFQLLVEKKIKKNPMKITEISFFFSDWLFKTPLFIWTSGNSKAICQSKFTSSWTSVKPSRGMFKFIVPISAAIEKMKMYKSKCKEYHRVNIKCICFCKYQTHLHRNQIQLELR